MVLFFKIKKRKVLKMILMIFLISGLIVGILALCSLIIGIMWSRSCGSLATYTRILGIIGLILAVFISIMPVMTGAV